MYFGALECAGPPASGDHHGAQLLPAESIRSILSIELQTVERNIPLSREYRLSFAQWRDKSGEKLSTGVTVSRIFTSLPFASVLVVAATTRTSTRVVSRAATALNSIRVSCKRGSACG